MSISTYRDRVHALDGFSKLHGGHQEDVLRVRQLLDPAAQLVHLGAETADAHLVSLRNMLSLRFEGSSCDYSKKSNIFQRKYSHNGLKRVSNRVINAK